MGIDDANPYNRFGSLMFRSPARLLFLLGIALLWAGIVPWILFVAFEVGALQSVFHSISLIQGFGTCFASGLVFQAAERARGADGQALPRPGPWIVALACLGPAGVSVCAFFDLLAASQVFWLVGVGALTAFAVRCWRRLPPEKRSPVVATWLVAGLVFGVAGTGVIAAFGMAGLSWEWHQMGRAWLLQGMLVSFVFAGILLLRSVFCGFDATPSWRVPFQHSGAAAGLAAMWVLEAFDIESSGGAVAGVRVSTMLWFVVDVVRLRRWPPSSLGPLRRCLALGLWAIPVGYLLRSFVFGYPQIGLHIVFIGGFVCLALTVSALLAPTRPPRLPVVVMLLALTVALFARVVFAMAPPNAELWLVTASVAILVATLAWLPMVRWRPSTPAAEK